MRCFLEDGAMSNVPRREEKSRLATSWWMITLNAYLFRKCDAGLEAYSSPETATKAAAMLGDNISLEYRAQLPELCKSSRWPYQWLGVPIDQCSAGVRGCNFLRRGLKLYTEPLYDASHGITRDMFGAPCCVPAGLEISECRCPVCLFVGCVFAHACQVRALRSCCRVGFIRLRRHVCAACRAGFFRGGYSTV